MSTIVPQPEELAQMHIWLEASAFGAVVSAADLGTKGATSSDILGA